MFVYGYGLVNTFECLKNDFLDRRELFHEIWKKVIATLRTLDLQTFLRNVLSGRSALAMLCLKPSKSEPHYAFNHYAYKETCVRG